MRYFLVIFGKCLLLQLSEDNQSFFENNCLDAYLDGTRTILSVIELFILVHLIGLDPLFETCEFFPHFPQCNLWKPQLKNVCLKI